MTARHLSIFLLLLLGSLVFFLPVLDNGFWHPEDYNFLITAARSNSPFDNFFFPPASQSFRPMVHSVFYLEFLAFGTDATRYYLFNIFLHGLNAFLVYLIVMTLLRHRTIAVLAGVLFMAAVGNYGKAVMVVSGVEDILITLLSLVTFLFYFRSELTSEGRARRAVLFSVAALAFFFVTLTKATSFSILGCFLAFNFLFRRERKRRVFDWPISLLILLAVVTVAVKASLLKEYPYSTQLAGFGVPFFRNVPRYLVRMVFPIHTSHLVTEAGPLVRTVYDFATAIRILIFLFIVSYTVFGFIFGNRTIRFFIAWIYITVIPFCVFQFPKDWVNIRYLYLVSVGFVILIASGTGYATRLLRNHRYKRALPYVFPLAFILLSHFVTSQLDKGYELKRDDPQLVPLRETFRNYYRIRRNGDEELLEALDPGLIGVAPDSPPGFPMGGRS
jgi:hypothetical protein